MDATAPLFALSAGLIVIAFVLAFFVGNLRPRGGGEIMGRKTKDEGRTPALPTFVLRPINVTRTEC